jgi:hypothetical protein
MDMKIAEEDLPFRACPGLARRVDLTLRVLAVPRYRSSQGRHLAGDREFPKVAVETGVKICGQ